MLPAGLAAVEEGRRRGTWTILESVEALEVPDDLAAALDAAPPARTDVGAGRAIQPEARCSGGSSRRSVPTTREARVEEIARYAAVGEKPPRFRREVLMPPVAGLRPSRRERT